MSVPKKRRTSSSVGRRNSHSALKKVTLNSCPKCKSAIKPHTACSVCGSYKGREAVTIKTKKVAKKATT